MEYTESIIWLLCWPTLIYGAYRLVYLNIKNLHE